MWLTVLCPLPVSDLVVLVIDAEPLPQVPEHHGTVFFELKATGQVFSEGEVGKKKQKQNNEHRGSLMSIEEVG